MAKKYGMAQDNAGAEPETQDISSDDDEKPEPGQGSADEDDGDETASAAVQRVSSLQVGQKSLSRAGSSRSLAGHSEQGSPRQHKPGKAMSEGSWNSKDAPPGMTEVQDRIHMLNLQKIVEGVKLGVFYRHATGTSRKKKGAELIQLKSHLQLVDMAKSLSPEHIEGTSQEDIAVAIRGLEGKVRWTKSLQLSLYDRRVAGLTACLESGGLLNFHEFMGTVWPSALDGGDEELNMLKLTNAALSAVGMKEKTMMLKQAVVHRVYCPLLEQGAEGEPQLFSIGTSLLEVTVFCQSMSLPILVLKETWTFLLEN